MKQAPPQPDYTGAANAQGAASMWNTQYQTFANRPDIYTPFGSVTWDRPDPQNPYALQATNGQPGGGGGGGGGFNLLDAGLGTLGGLFGGGRGGGRDGRGGFGAGGQSGIPNFSQNPGNWAMHMNLSPAQQQALEAQQQIQAGRSNMALGLMGRVGNELGSAPDWNSVPGLVSGEDARNQAVDAAYKQASSRLDPQWNQREAQFKNDLANQGAMPGSPMYEQQMADFQRSKNDAYTSAMNNATMYGEQAAQGAFGRSLTGHQQGITDILQRRGQSLNELQALLGGEQVGMPQMPGFAQAGAATPPNYLGAAQAGYGSALNSFNAQQAQLQGLLSGGANLASLAMMF